MALQGHNVNLLDTNATLRAMHKLKIYVQRCNYQLTHKTLKNIELLKHSKISKTTPTCFGLQGNHHQGATVSTWLIITHLVKSR